MLRKNRSHPMIPIRSHQMIEAFFETVSRSSVTRDNMFLRANTDSWRWHGYNAIPEINASVDPTGADMLRAATLLSMGRMDIMGLTSTNLNRDRDETLSLLVKKMKSKHTYDAVTLSAYMATQEEAYERNSDHLSACTKSLARETGKVETRQVRLDEANRFLESLQTIYSVQQKLDSVIVQRDAVLVRHTKSVVCEQKSRAVWLKTQETYSGPDGLKKFKAMRTRYSKTLDRKLQEVSEKHDIASKECDEMDATLAEAKEKDRVLLLGFKVICDALDTKGYSCRDALWAYFARKFIPLDWPEDQTLPSKVGGLPFDVKKHVMSFLY
jgi:hypothetical protein